jgi:hypothetical protein
MSTCENCGYVPGMCICDVCLSSAPPPSPDPIEAILANECPVKDCHASKYERCHWEAAPGVYLLHEARIRAALTKTETR